MSPPCLSPIAERRVLVTISSSLCSTIVSQRIRSSQARQFVGRNNEKAAVNINMLRIQLIAVLRRTKERNAVIQASLLMMSL